MAKGVQQAGAGGRAWYRRRSRVARWCLWLAAAAVVLTVLKATPLGGGLTAVSAVLCTVALMFLLVVLLYRWISQRVLWKVRNRLVLTYLLMGLAPIVLFGTLTGIVGYLLAGQYATNTALALLDQASADIRNETAGAAMFRALNGARFGDAGQPQHQHWGDSQTSLATLKGGVWEPLVNTAASRSLSQSPFVGQPQPLWMTNGFHGIVAYNGQLYLCSEISVSDESRSVPMLGSRLLDRASLAGLAKGLGRLTLLPGFTRLGNDKVDVDAPEKLEGAQSGGSDSFTVLKGGVLAPRAHLWDTPVLFSAPVPVLAWGSGEQVTALLAVVSRPTVLYGHLFATSVRIGAAVRDGLIAISAVFALLELLALLMAVGLSRTITRSVAELYQGTKEIDRGHLQHRVRVPRHDQLGALASSFNSMAASIAELLVQQREKERLLSELAIAQEVQTNLFPKSPVLLSGLEVHAVCIPARTVSGDYFDFIFGTGNGGGGSGNGRGGGSGLCLALGDISGKGISAALLMASLHSAVRAFSLSEVGRPSPALLLKLLNRHLYRSTQPSKYATLFLAYYDDASRKLTYSNGGHLPPLVLSRDGEVRQLDCGGSVVGLLDGLEYCEATVELKPGDLLMAFSDGLTEPENEFGEFGAQRLLDCIRQHRNQPLPTLAANTLRSIQEWIGDQEQPDDMTLLLARQLDA